MTIKQIEQQIRHDYNQLRATTVDYYNFTEIARHLASGKASTYSISRHFGVPCKDIRKILKRMEKLDYVAADSNGSNNIYWELKPCTPTT